MTQNLSNTRIRFSIIIPVYNVAPYLRECLDSVIAQTLTDWEAICVDDGSTDESSAILDEYGQKDSRFVIIHQKNSGVSAARNKGIESVRGDFFLFIDSDDLVECDYIEHLYALVKDAPDSVGSVGAVFFSDSDSTTMEYLRPKTGVYDTSSIGVRFHTGGVWNKIYPVSVLDGLKEQYFFKGLSFGEDAVFLLRALAYTKHIIVDGEYVGYRYRIRSNSLCHGHSALVVAKRYWDDVIALDNSNEGQADRYLVREFMYFCVLHHVIPLSNISDIMAYLEYVDEKLSLWRLLSTLKHREEDAIYRRELDNFSKAYAYVIMLRAPIYVKARLLLMARFLCKAQNKCSRLVNLRRMCI